MSAFNLTSIPGAQRISKTISGLGNLSPNILNGGSAKTEEGAGLLSSFGAATSKGRSIIWDKLLNIIFSVLSSLFSILRKITPSSIRNLLIFFIPPLLAFYELAFRVYFPKAPSLFVVAFKLYQRGHLTIGTVIWLASSLPGDILGGLGALGGVATHATTALAGGVTSAGNALAGTATHIVGDAANTINHVSHGLVSGEHAIPTGGLLPHIGQGQDVIQGAVGNANAITGAVIGATQGAATELAHVLDPLHIISKGSQDSQATSAAGNASVNTGAAIIQQAANPLAAATENVTKIANALESINPLHLNLALKGSQASQVLGQPNPIGSLLPPKILGF